MHAILAFLFILVSAAGMACAIRLRGDAIWQMWTGTGATTARAMCGAVAMMIVGGAEIATGGLTWAPPLVGLGLFVGLTLPTMGAIDAGRGAGSPWHDAAMNLLRGAGLVALPTVALWWFGHAWWALAAAGASTPAAYALGWMLPIRRWPFQQGAPAAEGLLGLFLGAGLAAAVLFGRLTT